MQTAVLTLQYRAVSNTQLAGVLLVAVYVLLFANRRPIPSKSPKSLSAGTSLTRLILRTFMAFGTTISLIAPWPFMLRGGYPAISLLSPPMFIGGVQLLFEIWCFRALFIPARLVVTVGFIGYRVWTIFEWIQGSDALEMDAKYIRLLGIVNFVFWGTMLLLMLLQITPIILFSKNNLKPINKSDVRGSSKTGRVQGTAN